MRINFILFFLSITLAIFQNETHGQKSLTKAEASFYAEAATNFLTVYDKNTVKKSEAVLMFLETDTAGRVKKINLMANSQEKRSLFGVLKKMKPDDFNNHQVNPGARDKVVIVPIYSLRYAADSSNYMDKMRMQLSPFNTMDSSAVVRESQGYIMVNGMSYVVGKPERH